MMAQLPKSAQSQLEQFLRSEGLVKPSLNQSPEQPLPNRERIKHILIGSPKVVTRTIHQLHTVNYASVGDWSPFLPTDNPDEVMSILIRHILML
jgi:hypothetical protein